MKVPRQQFVRKQTHQKNLFCMEEKSKGVK